MYMYVYLLHVCTCKYVYYMYVHVNKCKSRVQMEVNIYKEPEKELNFCLKTERLKKRPQSSNLELPNIQFKNVDRPMKEVKRDCPLRLKGENKQKT